MKCKKIFLLFLYYWLPPILYCIFIYKVSSISSISVETSLPHIDKVYHVILYFILALLLYRAFANSFNPSNRRYMICITFILTILYGCTDEIHQYFVPLRNADIWDIFFDAIGACIALGSIKYFPNILKLDKKQNDEDC